jgi:hypothetical protein
MDDKVVTLVVGLAGITATLISSGLGLYFLARARSAPLRESLFNKQLELVTKIIHKQERFRIFATILAGSDESFKELAREDIGSCVRDFSELKEEGSAILPVELWVEIRQLSSQMTSMLVEYDNGNGITEEDMRELWSRCAKVALISRAIIGADELTEESIKLFSSKKDYDKLTGLEVRHFEAIYNQKNA